MSKAKEKELYFQTPPDAVFNEIIQVALLAVIKVESESYICFQEDVHAEIMERVKKICETNNHSSSALQMLTLLDERTLMFFMSKLQINTLAYVCKAMFSVQEKGVYCVRYKTACKEIDRRVRDGLVTEKYLSTECGFSRLQYY